jgi:signal transduction histidine kinase
LKPVDAIIRKHREIRRIERGRLFRKYFLLILALVCGALLISGGIGIYFSYQENKVALASLQREKAIAAAARIEQFIRQIEQQLKFAALPQLGAGASGVEQRRMEFIKLQRLVQEITDTAQIDARGREQLAVSRLDMERVESNLDRSQDQAFRATKPNETWFGPVSFRKETEPYMSIAVRSSESGPVTVADVNLKFLWDVVTRIKIGKKGKAYVVDRTGHLVADPDIGLVLRKTDLSQLPQVKYAMERGADDSRALVAKDLAGESVLTAYGSIDPLGWKVFVEQPVSEVYATLDAAILRTVALMVVGLLLSMLVAMWLARSMVRPIRTLQEGAARIGAGNLEQRIEIKTGDELEALAEQFNQMSSQLRESYAGLERKVEVRTAELQETLDQQTATGEILRVISSSPTNVQPVFDALVKSALRLFDGFSVGVMLVKPDGVHLEASGGNTYAPADLEQIRRKFYPAAINRDSAVGRAILDRAVQMISDTHAAGVSPRTRTLSEQMGYRSLLMAPMVREGQAIGAVGVSRGAPTVFTEKQISLLQTFADQAVIAIENARLFREIQEKGSQLEIANRHKSEFLANMSHELRTPLNAIIGFSEVLVEKMFGEVNEKQLDYLKDIHSSGKHLLSLINDILDLSKIEAGRMELDISEFDPQAALQNAMTLVKERAQRSGVALSLEVDKSLTALHADERKFKQIMLNLLSNAVKFTPEGGKVTVAARPNGAAVEFSVADTGVGIAAEDQQLVFEEFRQVGRDYTRKAEGTGLGLALSKRFVELHGGELRLISAPGKGSTFTFTIPLRP